MTLIAWLRIAVAAAVLYLLGQLTPIYLPIILATVFAFVLNPLVNAIASLKLHPNWQGIPRGIAILAAFFIAGFIITVTVAFIFMPFTQEFNKLVANLPTLLSKIHFLSQEFERKATSAEIPDNVRILINQGLSSVATFSVGFARRFLNTLLEYAGKILEIVVVPVLAYYFLKDAVSLKESVISLFPPCYRFKARIIIDEMAIVISGYIRGQVLVSIIMGFLVFIGMYALGVDFPLVLGLIATLTETIPIIGPIIGAMPAILLAYLTEPSLAVKVIIFYLLIHQVENHIIVPGIMKRTVDLHPAIVIISLLIGGNFFGIVGMITAVPVAALLRVIFKHLWHYDEG